MTAPTPSLRDAAQMALATAEQVLVDMEAQDLMMEWQTVLDGALGALRAALALLEPVEPTLQMKQMEYEDGRVGWYINAPGFYCDIDPEPDGKYSVFCRDKQGREGFFDPAAPQPAHVERQPLNNDELQRMWIAAFHSAYKEDDGEAHEFFAHAIEAFHGIEPASPSADPPKTGQPDRS